MYGNELSPVAESSFALLPIVTRKKTELDDYFVLDYFFYSLHKADIYI